MGCEAPSHSSLQWFYLESFVCVELIISVPWGGKPRRESPCGTVVEVKPSLSGGGHRVDVLCFSLLLKKPPLILAAEHSRGVWRSLGLSLECLS